MEELSADHFLEIYQYEIRELANRYRGMIKEMMPGIGEKVDLPAKIIGFGFGPKYSDMICTLIPSQKGLKMGIYKGAELPDEKGLLKGSGKVHKHIELLPGMEESGVKAILDLAYDAYLKRSRNP